MTMMFSRYLLVALVGVAMAEEACVQPVETVSDEEMSLLRLETNQVKSRTKAEAPRGPADAMGQRGHTPEALPHLGHLSKAEKAEFLMAANDYAAREGKWSLMDAFTHKDNPIPTVLDAKQGMVFESRIGINGDRTFVAAAEVHTKIGPLQVHPFNLAVYFDNNSPLWGRRNSIEDLKNNSHAATIAFKTTQELPKWMPLQTVRTFMKGMVMPYVKEEQATEADVDALLNLQFGGAYAGRPPVSTVTAVRMDQDGFEVNILDQDGTWQTSGRYNSPKMTKAAVDMCVSKDSPVPGLSAWILGNLTMLGRPDGAHAFAEKAQTNLANLTTPGNLTKL